MMVQGKNKKTSSQGLRCFVKKSSDKRIGLEDGSIEGKMVFSFE